jgi:hypothetical protein
MTIHLSPEILARLEAAASATGVSVNDYLSALVERELLWEDTEPAPGDDDGMVEENGLLVYRTGKPLPTSVVDDAIRRLREERASRILGDVA